MQGDFLGVITAGRCTSRVALGSGFSVFLEEKVKVSVNLCKKL